MSTWDLTVGLKIYGLKKPGDPYIFYDKELARRVKIYCTLAEICDHLEKLGYERPEGFIAWHGGKPGQPIEVPANNPQPLYVTDGPSYYGTSKSLKINRNEPFASYISRLQEKQFIPESTDLAIQSRVGEDLDYERMRDSSMTTPAAYDFGTESPIFLVREDNSKNKFQLAIDRPEMRRTLLSEILMSPLVSGDYTVNALYPTRLRLIFYRALGSFVNRNIDTTVEYSPFLKVQDLEQLVLEQSREKYWGFELDTHPFNRDKTLVQAGIIGSAQYMVNGWTGPLPPVRFCRPKHRKNQV